MGCSPSAIRSPNEPSGDDSEHWLVTLTDGTTTEFSSRSRVANSCSHHGDRFKGVHSRGHRAVLLKRCQITGSSLTPPKKQTLENEAERLTKLRHPHILSFLGIGSDDQNVLYLVSLWVENSPGSLWECVSNGRSGDRPRYLLELAKAIEYLYSKRVVHGNIRAQSAIISAKDHILLYDFGFANLVASKVIAVTPSQPTPELYPPEVWDGGPRTYGSDVYSFGMTIYQVLSGEDPSSKYEETGMIATVISGERPPRTPSASPDGMSYDHLWQVAEECWQGCPNDRPAISTVRQWLTSPFGQPSSRKEITLRREKRGAARVTGRVAPILEESTESRSAPFGQPRHGSKSKFQLSTKSRGLQDGAGRSKSGPDVLSAGRPGETLPRETVTVTLDDSSTVETVLHPVDVGGFSDIFEGYQYRGSCKVALKRSRIAGESSSRIAEAMEREAAIWYEARDHPHVLPFLGRGHDGKGLLYLVSPYMANGNLWTYVQSGISMGEERDCPKYLKEIASALGFVHSKEIIHGDVKALNILISTDDHAYLCDFGSALGISQARLPASRTPRHMSPELWSGNSNTKSSDVYAFGITIYEVLSGEIPFNDTWDESALQRFILQGNRPPSHPADSPSGIDYSPLWDIAKRCWRAEANNRPTMQTVYGDLRAAMLTPGGLEPHSKT